MIKTKLSKYTQKLLGLNVNIVLNNSKEILTNENIYNAIV